MRLVVCCLSFILCGMTAQAQSPKAVMDYIEKYKNIAIEEMRLTGIPASVTLAQGIHESGCGQSVLALNSNNHFGIKCHNEWSGASYRHDDDQPQECFRVYKSPEESFKDHSDFLKNRPRYAGLFKLKANDYKGWARGLKAAGYATNPQYPQIIIGLIEAYKLYDLDRQVLNGDAPAQPVLASASAVPTASAPGVPAAPTQYPQSMPAQPRVQQTTSTASVETVKVKAVTTPVSTPATQINAAYGGIQLDERLINGVRAIVFKPSVTLYAIGQKYNVSVEDLYAFNDMTAGTSLKAGEYVYLEKKKSETSYYQYELTEGETMRDVAQKFGVQLPELYKRNGINTNCQPLAGQVIVLRGNRETPLKFHVVDNNGKATPADGTTGVLIDTRYHKVEDSDTLYSIARQYNVPVEDLMRLNGLKDNDIKIGQTLLISSL
ncbi:MAG: LysM peptidoglycan-binding domain-containing protein [Bacteroidetes bacterium]|nr:LysM peptidoglycan-binding domain-containing protein [Bacteroidota bacterium]